jgi:hypothetical protein
MNNKNPQLSRLFSIFVDETTLHGFPEIHKSKSIWLKVFWMVVLILSIIAVVYGISQLVNEFNERPTLTLYDWKSEEEGLKFPPVLICSEILMINYTKLKRIKNTLANCRIGESVNAGLFVDTKSPQSQNFF